MSWETLKLIIAGSLFLHAIAHVIALFALLAESLGGSRVAQATSRSWLLPRLAPQAVAVVGSVLWAASTTGFLVAAAGFWGLLAAGATWRSVAIASAGVSILGIALRAGTWPGSPSVRRSALNTLVAMTMNVAILVALALLRWPPMAIFGR
jgi:hypothetical protein